MNTNRKWTEDELEQAHTLSANNRPALLKDSRCGCFRCMHIFDPAEIKNWIIDPTSPIDDLGTATCPYCGVDSVIGESSGFPIDEDFLDAMSERYFTFFRLFRKGALTPELLERLAQKEPPEED